eukprot:7880112-Alexandrium_andersonii.AAC.1
MCRFAQKGNCVGRQRMWSCTTYACVVEASDGQDQWPHREEADVRVAMGCCSGQAGCSEGRCEGEASAKDTG